MPHCLKTRYLQQQTNPHNQYIRRCFELAKAGEQFVSPNPVVGAVIVKNNQIIGEGFHRKHGGPHAEVNAVNAVKAPHTCKGATIYVSLEPCAHTGLTPPCADLLVKEEFAEVVISCGDPFKEVNGKGVERLKKAGINVITGMLEPEGRFVNRYFFTSVEKQRPYILLKWAQTTDGFIDKERKEGDHGPNWISTSSARKMVHGLRANYDAIMVGTTTALVDDPELTVRDVYGTNPIRIVLDKHLKLPKSLRLFNAAAPTLVFNEVTSKTENSVEWVQIDFNNLLPELLSFLHKRKVQRLLIEGGKHTLEQFIAAGLWDEAKVITGPTFFKKGLSAPTLAAKPDQTEVLDSNVIQTYYKT